MIEVRTPRPDEKPLWLPLWSGYLDFYGTALPGAVTDLTWERFRDPAEPMRLLCAFDGEKMAGFAAFVFHRSTWALDHYCYLEDLFVGPAFRGRGIGRELIAGVRQAARAGKAGRLYWVTREGNAGARALYASLAERTDFIQYRMPLEG